MNFNLNGIMPNVAENYNNTEAHNELKAMMLRGEKSTTLLYHRPIRL